MGNPIAVFDTSLGTFKAEIFLDKMPVTSQNFVDLAKSGFEIGSIRIRPLIVSTFSPP